MRRYDLCITNYFLLSLSRSPWKPNHYTATTIEEPHTNFGIEGEMASRAENNRDIRSRKPLSNVV